MTATIKVGDVRDRLRERETLRSTMTPAKFRAKVNACGSAEIAQRAGTTRRSVERARARGAPPRGERGDAMLAAIAALSAKPVESNGAEHRADGQHDSAIYRDERGLLIFPLKCARYPKFASRAARAALPWSAQPATNRGVR